MAPPAAVPRGRMPSLALHAVGLLSFGAVFAWLPRISNPLHRGFGGSFQFLTIIALSLSTATFAVGLLADVLPARPLQRLKTCLSTAVTPLEVLVTVFYWGLRAVDKRLVVPPGHEVPLVPDLGFHAMPAAWLVLDLLLLSPPWTVRPTEVLALGTAMTASYFAWVEYCFTQNGWYPYPLLMKLSPGQKLVVGAGSALLMSGSTLALKQIHRRLLAKRD